MKVTSKPVFTVRVRDLVEFVLRRGDLGGSGDFFGRNRALAGTRGHQRIQRSRPPDYRAETPVVHEVETGDFILRIKGRIDGLMNLPGELSLEEIKTVQSSWDGVPNPLHWAQAKFYAFILSRSVPFDEISLTLTYLNLDTAGISEFKEFFRLEEIVIFATATLNVYLEWIGERFRWYQKRDVSISGLKFPFANFRPGQRELAVAAYRTFAEGGRLFIEAPTGIGKTISVLFPAVKALGEGKLERIFYLTARTSGRRIAESALAQLREVGLHLRSVTLTAKQKVCLRDGTPCDLTTCPLALGYYDRCREAIREGLTHESLTRDVIQELGEKHQVCPFELALDLLVWVDAVICDYNYLFDPKVYLRRHFHTDGLPYAFLVDEAHNLVDRGREMFSAELHSDEISKMKEAVNHSATSCAKALTKLVTAMRKFAVSTIPSEAIVRDEFLSRQDLFERDQGIASFCRGSAGLPRNAEVGAADTPSNSHFSVDFMRSLGQAITETEKWLAKNEATDFRGELLQLYFNLLSFHKTAESYDDHFATIVDGNASVRVKLFCLDPSGLIKNALDRGKASIFFSATLTPAEYYREMLGGIAGDRVLRLPSPFPREHLSVLIHDRIETRFKARQSTVVDVAESIGTFIKGRAGNYLVFFPSFQYLEAVLAGFKNRFPEINVMAQTSGMAEKERENFLDSFAVQSRNTLAGFAVLGGIFAEGIDLMGEALIGAVIVGVGLPQISVERNLVRKYFDEHSHSGFDYAYTFPGMSRVLQAVGRVIRSENDRGAVLLIDARFGEHRYRKLLPLAWQTLRVRSQSRIADALASFWSRDAHPHGCPFPPFEP